MALVDFSELTYAFALLRELEGLFGSYVVPPIFITQAEEFSKGYDAQVDLGGTIAFLQFKRSEVMTRASAKEIWHGHFSSPVFRMHLHKRHNYGQHLALQALEAEGNAVLYATSGARNREDLFHQSSMGQLTGNSGLFTPAEIVLPDVVHPHHVSFKRGGSKFRVYSENGDDFERRVVGVAGLRNLLAEHALKPEANEQRLRKFVEDHSTTATNRFIAAAEDRAALNPDIRMIAATVALLRYDLSLVITKP